LGRPHKSEIWFSINKERKEKGMKGKRLITGVLLGAAILSMGAQDVTSVMASETADAKEIVLEKSTLGNPIAGFDENGDIVYAGDPNILVDGDTVYLYVGHDDTGSGGGYTMPDYLCYSTQDLKNWEYEGVVMEMTDVAWADNTSAWAAQVTKHNGKYYMLYCAENSGSYGKEVGVAVADSPTGPFVPQDEPYFHENETNTKTCEVIDPDTGEETTAGALYGRRDSFGWEDIDPTVWFDTDENGEEHIYMMWGNTNAWMCELEDDMLSIKDQNGDGEITQGVNEDIWYQHVHNTPAIDGVDFTEAPWLYRRQNEDGEYFGDYYVFFASHWREEMAYATCDSVSGNFGPNSYWEYGGGIEGYGHLMEPTATSNTNHPAVFDFQGKTYFVYHNGSLPGGSGFRRVICVEELKFNEDGSIDYIQETSTGISGTASQLIDSSNTQIAHDSFHNSVGDPDYEYNYPQVNVPVTSDADADKADALWEIEPAKYRKTEASYITIESYNKPGMYLRATGTSSKVVLSRDHNNDSKSSADGTTEYSKQMTFRTLEGFAGYGVTLESVAYPGKYVTKQTDGSLKLTDGSDKAACTFTIARDSEIVSMSVQKSDRSYFIGEKIKTDDIRVRVTYADGVAKYITAKSANGRYQTNVASINTAKAGAVNLTVSYTEGGITLSENVKINVHANPASTVAPVEGVSLEEMPASGTILVAGNLRYQITKTDEMNSDGYNGAVTLLGSTKSKIKSVKIPDYITMNGYDFKVDQIAANAFKKQTKLKTITIGNNVKKIGKKAFDGINKKATFKVSSDRYKAVKKLLKSSTGFKKTMKIKEI